MGFVNVSRHCGIQPRLEKGVMKNWITGKIIFWITNSRGFSLWIGHQARLDIMNITLEYRLYCKAHDVEQTFEGFTDYVRLTVTGGRE